MKLALVFLLLTIVAVTWAQYDESTEESTTEVYWTTYSDDLDVGIPDRWAEKRRRDQGEAGGQGGGRGGQGGGRGGDRGNRDGEQGGRGDRGDREGRPDRGGPRGDRAERPGRGPRPTMPESAIAEE
ncbi:hypothetical protein HDE_10353 [Halotydeus destructor]|nr:hypothetical protein HDE_10353 [Halotydeus destructor]